MGRELKNMPSKKNVVISSSRDNEGWLHFVFVHTNYVHWSKVKNVNSERFEYSIIFLSFIFIVLELYLLGEKMFNSISFRWFIWCRGRRTGAGFSHSSRQTKFRWDSSEKFQSYCLSRKNTFRRQFQYNKTL